MYKLKIIVLTVVFSAPLFVVAGYKWAEHKTSLRFIEISVSDLATETKAFTKMGVMLHNRDLDNLSTYISIMAYKTHSDMIDSAHLFGLPVDSDATSYFNSNKSKLVSPNP